MESILTPLFQLEAPQGQVPCLINFCISKPLTQGPLPVNLEDSMCIRLLRLTAEGLMRAPKGKPPCQNDPGSPQRSATAVLDAFLGE